ncbi:hypothetical protein BHM03_00016309 [Ensete ventricosum]|nr:hypothetical protein BHM03_00016309 [Ensete ventricosum]
MQRHIYGYEGKNIQIFADNSSLAVNPSYVKSWLDLLSRTPRVAPFLSKSDPIISALKKIVQIKVCSTDQYLPYRAVFIGPLADWYADRPLPGGTVDWGSFRPVTIRNQLAMVDFDHRWSLSGDNG